MDATIQLGFYMEKKTTVRTRFAPSPTGAMHIGNLRTALYAYALAKSKRGDFILRIEDTDKKREKVGGVEEIKSLLTIFGIKWDEYYVQSERMKTGIYKNAADKLVLDGHAFYCQCEAKNADEKGYSKELRDPCRDKNLKSGAVKLKVPEKEKVSFFDFILKKEVSWDTSTISDTTILKSDGYPTYHLAVVVDDTDIKITHVLRGHDWMPSTPIHLLIYKYLGYVIPEIGHLTDILDPDGGKLSKRKGSTSCRVLLSEGYLPDAILNFIMLTGWAPKDNREIYSLEEFVKAFNPDGFQIANPIFNKEKLNWFNGYYIRSMKNEVLVQVINELYEKKLDIKILEKSVPLIKERIVLLSDYMKIADFFYKKPELDKSLMGENYKNHLQSANAVLTGISDWRLDKINGCLTEEIGKKVYKTGPFFMDLRIAVTGKKFTPPINESIAILGKVETLIRIGKALNL
jgi:glutamyl-tRNA synthetase